MGRALAGPSGVREHLRHRRAPRDRGGIGTCDAERSGARGRGTPGGLHTGLHRALRWASRAARDLWLRTGRHPAPAAGGQIRGPGRVRGRRHRRVLDGWTDRAPRPRGAPRRPGFLPALRGRRACQRGLLAPATGRDRRAERALGPARRRARAGVEPPRRVGRRPRVGHRPGRVGGAGARRRGRGERMGNPPPAGNRRRPRSPSRPRRPDSRHTCGETARTSWTTRGVTSCW